MALHGGLEDLFQKKVVGWSFGSGITKEMVISALEQAEAVKGQEK